MRKLLNTLYISGQGSYVHRKGETVVIDKKNETIIQIPIHSLSSIVCFGNILISPSLLGFCAERNIAISFLTEYGKFLASVQSPMHGNVLLRRQHYRIADDIEKSFRIASFIITAKLANCRIVLNRTIRDHSDKVDVLKIKKVSDVLNFLIDEIRKARDIDTLRGIEGQAAAAYFSVFNDLIIEQKEDFIFKERNRRPPLDEVNALLSFIYTILMHDIKSSLETLGLDPAVGFLHRDRPGRPGLALDIMEEFRPVLADRLVLSLINRKQVTKREFIKAYNGSVTMEKETIKKVLTEYENRKKDEILHSYIGEKVPIGLLFFIQANLMARFIRGDIDGYPPFFWR